MVHFIGRLLAWGCGGAGIHCTLSAHPFLHMQSCGGVMKTRGMESMNEEEWSDFMDDHA